jgi:hypothetical protein
MGHENGEQRELSNGLGNNGKPPGQPPLRRVQYLHRFGSDAMLQVVEFYTAEDGTVRKRSRLCRWPGL